MNMQTEQKTIAVAEVTLEIAMKTFLNVEMVGLSERTKYWYKFKLKGLARYLGENKNVIDIFETDLLNYCKNLDKSKLAPDTKHGYIRAIKKFFKFLYDHSIIPVNLAVNLKLPKLPIRARKGISDKNVHLLLEAARNNKRDFALLHFLESTNARLGGIASLKISNLNMEQPEPLCRRVIVHEKGDKDRTVIMSKAAFDAMKDYLAVRSSTSEFVFLTNTGTPLTSAGIAEILSRYKKRLGIKEPVSPHQWRHRWCRKRLQDGMPLPQVSQLAGHKTIAVTANFYGTFAIDELQEAFDRYYVEPN